MPLQNDPGGYPKRPIVSAWTSIKRWMPDIDALPWAGAAGLGLVLGPTSSNLAVIDIDSRSLARAVYQIVKSHGQEVYAVRTGRRNMHLYITELEPSASSKFPIKWEGEQLYIEFKGRGTQVAAPPSPGYQVIQDDLLVWQNLASFWELLDHRLRYLYPDVYKPGGATDHSNSGTPSAQVWAPEVADGNRNDTLYVEAHKLREAGMPHDQALSLLTARVRQHYQANHNISQDEISNTVASAYRRGVVQRVGDTPGPPEFSPL